MGRRWWQKEARAKAAQEIKDRKNAPADAAQGETTEPSYAALDQATEGTVTVIEDVVNALEQVVSEIEADASVLGEEEAAPEQDDEPVVVPGITLSVNNMGPSSNKKKRRR